MRPCSPLASWLTALALLGPAAGTSPAAGPALLDEAALASHIDAHLDIRLKAAGVPAAPRNDDATYLRALYLDLTGCIPPLIDARDFLGDPRPDKRRAWADAILTGRRPSGKPDAHPRHLAAVLRSWVLSRTTSDDVAALARPVEEWLLGRLKAGVRYDALVREMIAASPAVDGRIVRYGLSANLYYQANGFKPENLAASTGRLFLGVTLDCAQCHDDRSGGGWTRDQFWSLAAFFGGVDPVEFRVSDRREVDLPGGGVARARYLGGGEPAWPAGADPRAALAGWVTGPDNPYFARAAVNRVWWYLFGTGLTDPVDGHGDHNPPSHPELLDELARQFAGHGYDLAYLFRAIVLTEAYQRSGAPTHPGQDDPRLFARKAVRGLGPEQLFDSLAEATDFRGVGTGPGERDPDPGTPTPREQFLARFTDPGGAAEAPATVPQALYMMNSSFVAGRTITARNRTLAAVAADPRGGTGRQVETLFLLALSRRPSAREAAGFAGFVEVAPAAARGEALADVLWVLLNSAEFRLKR